MASDALVMPRISGSYVAFSPLAFTLRVLALEIALSTSWPGSRSVSPFDSTRTFFSICRTISSMCLSWISTPWLL